MEDFILMLESEFANLVEEHLGAASNEYLWALGSDDPESATQHETYAEHNSDDSWTECIDVMSAKRLPAVSEG